MKSIQGINWQENKSSFVNNYDSLIDNLMKEYGIPMYFAKHLIDFGLYDRNTLARFFEDNPLFMTPPFLFKDMNRAISLISKVKERNETIFLYGDSDVDGILGLTLLYRALKKYGIKNILFSIPEQNEVFGITKEKIELAYKKGAKLIITIDNGISNIDEVLYAKEKGINFIVTDHHTPHSKIPEADAIINPKVEKIPYSADLSGCGVVFKLAEALFLSVTKLYRENLIFLSFNPIYFKHKDGTKYFLNLTFTYISSLQIEFIQYFSIPVSRALYDKSMEFHEESSENDNPLFFSLGKVLEKESMKDIFMDLANKVNYQKYILIAENITTFNLLCDELSFDNQNLLIKNYSDLIENDEKAIENIKNYRPIYASSSLYSYFKFFVSVRYNYKKNIEQLLEFLPYVAIATVADIMPLNNENRFLVSSGLKLINEKKPEFVTQIISNLFNVSYPITIYDIVWKLSPLLNSPGRFGKGNLLLSYFLNSEKDNAIFCLKEIIEFNLKRSNIVEQIFNSTRISEDRLPVIFIEKEGVEAGLTGLLASKFLSSMLKPTIFITKTQHGIYGSMRSKENFSSFAFISQFEKYFINYGGHPYAAGFTVIPEKYDSFKHELLDKIEKLPKILEIPTLFYTCELSFDEIQSDEFIYWFNFLQPFGEGFKTPTFLTQNVILSNPTTIGRNNSSTKFKATQEDITFDALFFKGKHYIQDLKLNEIAAIIYEPQISQNKISLLISDILI
ncbi:MAG TPA: DHH family phosphoesterase [Exilispira sp.]|nr:DHH family phosphoesterase [Exilispira sp.]